MAEAAGTEEVSNGNSNGLENLAGQVSEAANRDSGDWRSRIPADLKGEKVWDTFKTEEDLFKSHVNLVKYQGQSVKIPGADAKPEERDAFYQKLGWPESPDKYQVKRPDELPEGMVYNEDLEKLALSKLHKAHMNNEQIQAVMDLWNQDVATQVFKRTTAEECQTALKEQWGSNYQTNENNVQKAMRTLMDDKTMEYFEAKGMTNDPVIITLLARVGASMQEDQAIGVRGDGASGPNKDALSARYAEIIADPKYLDASSPQHNLLHQERERIFRQLQGMR